MLVASDIAKDVMFVKFLHISVAFVNVSLLVISISVNVSVVNLTCVNTSALLTLTVPVVETDVALPAGYDVYVPVPQSTSNAWLELIVLGVLVSTVVSVAANNSGHGAELT